MRAWFLVHLVAFAVLVMPAAAAGQPKVRVLDGDTIVVGREHIRLLAIDAPELPGHCAVGRHCAPGDALASKAAMIADVAGAKLIVHRTGKDRWGRTVADVMANGKSLSCMQLEAGQAIYWARYDEHGRISAQCPAAAQKTAGLSPIERWHR